MNRRELVRLGWRENSLAYLEKHLQGYKDPQAYQEQYQSVFFFASPLFQNMWFQEIKDLTETAAQDLLRGVMKILLMPSDLSGTCEETAFLLSRMAPDCPPGSDFWKAFSHVVQVAFERDRLADQSGDQLLKRQVHSCATYFQVTRHNGFGRIMRELDRLTKRPYKLTYRRLELSRWMLMQMPPFTIRSPLGPDGHLHYPSGASQQVNFKVLLNFHTEYILDQAGHFLNEVDPVEISENGIVNGAKVLYRQGVRYLAPKNDRGEQGYWSQKGVFAQGGKSYKQQVARRVRSFLRGIPRLRWRVLLQNGLHRIL